MKLGNLHFEHAKEDADIGRSALDHLQSMSFPTEVSWTSIDPANSDNVAFTEAYEIGPELGANTIILRAKGGGEKWYAAVLVWEQNRADVNKKIKKMLGASKVSFASREDAETLTNQQYGGIGPLGLPADWPLLIDEDLMNVEHFVVGSGVRQSKVLLASQALDQLPNSQIVDLKID